MKKNNNKRERNESQGLTTVQAERKKKKKKIPCTPFRVHSQKDKHHLICKRLPFGDDKKKMWLEETLTWKSPDPVLRTCVTFSAVSAAGLQGNWVLGFYKQCGGLE